ncbi:hypothetical protein ABE494_16625 [Stenotrophomonas lactitubi]|jgi:outer membrane receptor protein involved in Fe transport|uniref:hypothetical protein n=1 Tax=Stenotrophomonas lactitubi TaxID=2045214 RepID=UPI0032078D6D
MQQSAVGGLRGAWREGVRGAGLIAAVFTYTVNDIQLNGNGSDRNGVLFNADKAKAYGFEADMELHPIQEHQL